MKRVYYCKVCGYNKSGSKNAVSRAKTIHRATGCVLNRSVRGTLMRPKLRDVLGLRRHNGTD
jgi:hypothetical protein